MVIKIMDMRKMTKQIRIVNSSKETSCLLSFGKLSRITYFGAHGLVRLTYSDFLVH